MDDLKSRFEKISQSFDRDKMQGEIRALEAQMMQPGFWDDRQRAEVVSRQLSDKNKTLETLESLEQNLDLILFALIFIPWILILGNFYYQNY